MGLPNTSSSTLTRQEDVRLKMTTLAASSATAHEGDAEQYQPQGEEAFISAENPKECSPLAQDAIRDPIHLDVLPCLTNSEAGVELLISATAHERSEEQHQPQARPDQIQDTHTESKDDEVEGETWEEVSNEEEPEIDVRTEFLNKMEKRKCAISYTLPRIESATLLRIHWLDKEKPKPEIPDMDAHGNSPNLDDGQGDNMMVQVQFEEQAQTDTPVKTSRYNYRSLSKEEISEIQSSNKNK